jgi:alkaline phosphatase D
MRGVFNILLGCLLLSVHGQEMPKNSDWAMQQPYVVMISIDGFRHDYAEKFNAPNLLEIKTLGTSAKSMIPGFPSKTFPNHYSLVTGMYPNTHGIVGNSFYSREKKTFFTLGNPSKVQDASWYGGKPIWTLAEQNGMLSASYFWAGSEAPVEGFRPTFWKSYDHNVPHEDRVAQVLDWIRLAPAERPHLITLYFSLVDDAGHAYGPDADETKDAVLMVDRLIGQLRLELRKLDLPIYLLITSDHGMTAINRSVSLHDVKFKDAVVDYSSTMAMIYHDDPKVITYIARLLRKKEQLQIFTRAEMGKLFGFDNADRVGDLIALSEPPVQILKSPSAVRGGAHGYDPLKFPEMGAFFLIEGSNVKKGEVLEPFENVHVYPMLARILGLPLPATIDGDAEVLEEIWME